MRDVGGGGVCEAGRAGGRVKRGVGSVLCGHGWCVVWEGRGGEKEGGREREVRRQLTA